MVPDSVRKNEQAWAMRAATALAMGDCRFALTARHFVVRGIRERRGRYRRKAPPVVLSPIWYLLFILPRLHLHAWDRI